MTTSARWRTAASEVLRAGAGFALADVDPDSTPGYTGRKRDGVDDLAEGATRLGELQERLFAQSVAGTAEGSVLLLLQAMDTAGKGGVVRHVVGAVDPQGVELAAFKKPTEEELAHDFLWRVERRLPEPGRIGVFDRSHYEDVLIGRVRALAPPEEIQRRYGAIEEFEADAAARGIRWVKVMLHLSREEQRKRLADRLDRPDKQWKYNPGDVDEQERWDDYMAAYQVAIERTSSEAAPWHVVPADRKWYARLAVQELLAEALAGLNPTWPAPDYDVEREKARLAAT
ncbi:MULTISPECIES: PPK2 family polyphosphate kinase [Microbacterium]|uniref:Polyphosphate kinase 2 family protein n=1 Tax=Microbacterium wangchenii TaxID=2541726 RepID=A0ABX5SYD6_9MICO|nr:MULTISPECIES: PPK2 family polyphosphate kinase [Microbacterium]MCK6067218.1 polyphosphate kinase 2 family protein [Microbacterium sp. EYE_512]QBR89829.1 polyphosphate kinase 2 family protein [Microbacterium wangchenii]